MIDRCRLGGLATLVFCGGVVVHSVAVAQNQAPSPPQDRPNPRAMSGLSRPQQGDPGGQLTVRPLQGDFRETDAGRVADVPIGARIHLVGLRYDGTTRVESKTVAKENDGRVVFSGLDRSGTTTYYVLSLFKREAGRDRLLSRPVGLVPMVGSRLMLAGHSRTSSMPPIDDLSQLLQSTAPEAGTVRVQLVGDDMATLQSVKTVELLRAGEASGHVADVAPQALRPDDIRGEAAAIAANQPTAQPMFIVASLNQRMPQGLVDVPVVIRDAKTNKIVEKGQTDPNGRVVTKPLGDGRMFTATAKFRGKSVTSEPFDAARSRSHNITFIYRWNEAGTIGASFTGVASGNDQVYVARTNVDGRTVVSVPFQLSPDLGATVPLLVSHPVRASLLGHGNVDDERMFFSIRMTLSNRNVYAFGTGDGVRVPLPQGFGGASVPEELSRKVKVTPDGFLVRGALPPGETVITGGFSLPVTDGEVFIDMDAPFGVANSFLVFEDLPGMTLDVPPGAEVIQGRPDQNGRPTRQLNIPWVERDNAIAFWIRGLPERPVWQRWTRILVGLGVVALLVAAFAGLFVRRPEDKRAAVHRALRWERQRLLEQLASLESDNKYNQVSKANYGKRREALMDKLTTIYRELDEAG